MLNLSILYSCRLTDECMKLAEALILRGDIQKRIEQIRDRLKRSSWIQEGETPPEDPQALFREVNEISEQLQTLISQINRTNSTVQLPSGQIMTEALAERDVITLRQSILRSVADAASQRVDRYGRAEIRRRPTVDVGQLRHEIDILGKRRRILDTTIQATNWTVDLTIS
jgi:methyl-accepting chemotaxis protein